VINFESSFLSFKEYKSANDILGGIVLILIYINIIILLPYYYLIRTVIIDNV
jgi:hypothetical protein